MLLDTTHIIIDTVDSSLLRLKQIEVNVARLDKIHPVVSGNKIFKLNYFLEEAISQHRPIVTFGGAYSNHLAATAFACKCRNIRSIGFVRGEEPAELSQTLHSCIADGM